MAEPAPGPTDGATRESPAGTRRRWAVFLVLAGGVVLLDQLSKAWVDAGFERASRSIAAGEVGGPTEVIGELVRIAKTYNDGAIFGLFEAAAPILAVLSILIVGGIGWYEWRHGARVGPVVNLGLALLVGGALGNLIDRLRFGHVIDFIDAGIGSSRWFAFNVADAAVSMGILLLFLGAVLGDRVGSPAARGASAGEAAGRGNEGTATSTSPPPGSA